MPAAAWLCRPSASSTAPSTPSMNRSPDPERGLGDLRELQLRHPRGRRGGIRRCVGLLAAVGKTIRRRWPPSGDARLKVRAGVSVASSHPRVTHEIAVSARGFEVALHVCPWPPRRRRAGRRRSVHARRSATAASGFTAIMGQLTSGRRRRRWRLDGLLPRDDRGRDDDRHAGPARLGQPRRAGGSGKATHAAARAREARWSDA